MNKIELTNDEIKRFFEKVWASNDEPILINEDSEQRQVNIVEYLNTTFYTWKNRLVSKNGFDGNTINTFDAWANSLRFSLNESYALVELTDATVLASPDIDNGKVSGRVTFIMQTNKIALLEYYAQKLRNTYLGVPQQIQTRYGDMLDGFVNIGLLTNDGEIETTQMGECVTASLNFSVSYLSQATSYTDIKYEFSFDGTNYSEVHFTKGSLQHIFTTSAVPKQDRPDIAGFIATSGTGVQAYSFYDFPSTFVDKWNEKFFLGGASFTKVGNGTITPTVKQNINIAVYLKITYKDTTYYYDMLLGEMKKEITNGDFNVNTMVLKSNARRRTETPQA